MSTDPKQFAAFDVQGRGMVTLDDMKSVLVRKGIAFDSAALANAFGSADRDGDGNLSSAEFSQMDYTFPGSLA